MINTGAGRGPTPPPPLNLALLLCCLFYLTPLGGGRSRVTLSGFGRGATAWGGTVVDSPHVVRRRLRSWWIQTLRGHCHGLWPLATNNPAWCWELSEDGCQGTGRRARHLLDAHELWDREESLPGPVGTLAWSWDKGGRSAGQVLPTQGWGSTLSLASACFRGPRQAASVSICKTY